MAVTTIELSKQASNTLGCPNCKQYFWCSFIYAYEIILCLHIFCQTRATTTGRLLGLTTCLPHKDKGIPLSTLVKDNASKLAGLFSTLYLLF